MEEEWKFDSIYSKREDDASDLRVFFWIKMLKSIK